MANRGNPPGPPSPEQLELTEQLAAAMKDLATTGPRLEATFTRQAAAFRELCDAMACIKDGQTAESLEVINENLKQVITSINGLRGTNVVITDMSRNAESAAKNVGSVSSQVNSINPGKIKQLEKELDRVEKQSNKSNKSFGLLKKSLGGAFLGAINGVIGGFQMLWNVSKAGLSLLSGLAKGFFKIGKAIVSIPLNMFKGIVNMAESGMGEINELMQVMNDMRKEFGTLSGPTNKAIFSTADAMENMGLAGASTFQIFGNVAERQRALLEMYAQSGPALRSFQKEILAGNGAILGFQKGLGLSTEQLETFAQRARVTGEPITKSLLNITKQADHLGKAFKLDAKIISKEMGKAAQDMQHFGHVSEKQIGVAVTYAQKLGIQLDKITGSFDKFSTFDDAAENISRLNEAFDANIDIGEVLAEQDPAKRFDILRKGLRATGIQGEKLTYTQKQMLQSMAGWDAATSEAALSTKNMGVSYKDIQKQGDVAEKKTLTQADAMAKLTDAMERNLKTMNPPGGGFFGKFTAGILAGMEQSAAFRKLMMNVKSSLMGAFEAGRKFGGWFMKNFPGMQKIMEGLAAIFDPAKFNKLFGGVTAAFQKFITTLKKDPKAAVSGLTKDLKDTFFNFFNKEAPEGRKLLDGFKDIFKTIVAVIAGVIPFIMQKVSAAIRELTNFISNPRKYIDEAKKKAASAAASGQGFVSLLSPIFTSISESWPELKKALTDLFHVAWGKLKPVLEHYGKILKGYLWEFMIKRAIFGALQGAAGPLLTAGFEALVSGALPGIKLAFAGLKKFLGPTLSKLLPGVGWAVLIADAAINVTKSIEKFSGHLEKKGFDPATAKIAAGTTGLINTLTLGLLPQDLQMKIAEAIAGWSKAVFNALDKWFGPGFSDSIKKYYASAFDIVAGIGDLLLALWNGDQSKVNAALDKIADGIVGYLEGAVEVILNFILKVGPRILEYLFKAVGFIIDRFAMILEGIKSSPLLRILVGVFTGGISEILFLLIPAIKKIGEFFTMSGKGWGLIGDAIKKINITQTLREWGTAIIGFFTKTGDEISYWADVISLPFKLVYHTIKTVFEAIYEEIINPSIIFLKTAGEMIFNVLVKPFKLMWEFVQYVFNKIVTMVEGVIGGIKTAWTPIYELLIIPIKALWETGKNLLGFLWDTFLGLIEKFRVWGHQVLDILTDPHTKAWGRIQKVLAFIWDGFKKLPENLIPWGKELFHKITNPFKEAVEDIKKFFTWDNIKKTFFAIVAGIKESLSAIADATPFKMLISLANKVLKIKSPSKVFEEVGQNVAEGMDNGMKDIPKNAEEKFKSVADAGTATAGTGPSAKPAEINDKAQTAVQIIKVITDLINALASVIGGKKIDAGIISFADASAITSAVPPILQLLDGVGDRAGKIMESLIKVVNAAPIDETFGKKLETTSKIFGFLTNLMTVGQHASDAKFDGGFVNGFLGSLADIDRILKGMMFNTMITGDMGSIKNIVEHLEAIFAVIPSDFGDKGKKLQDLLTSVTSIMKVFEDPFKGVEAPGGIVNHVLGNLANIDRILHGMLHNFMAGSEDGIGNVADVASHLTELAASIPQNINEKITQLSAFSKSLGDIAKVTTEMAGKSVVPAVVALEEMITAGQRLENALTQGGALNIDTKLKAFASRFGKNVGSLGSYTIKSKDVNITVNFRIAMDSSELERIMVTKKDSLIKTRIDNLIDAVQGTDSAKTTASKLVPYKFGDNTNPLPVV